VSYFRLCGVVGYNLGVVGMLSHIRHTWSDASCRQIQNMLKISTKHFSAKISTHFLIIAPYPTRSIWNYRIQVLADGNFAQKKHRLGTNDALSYSSNMLWTNASNIILPYSHNVNKKTPMPKEMPKNTGVVTTMCIYYTTLLLFRQYFWAKKITALKLLFSHTHPGYQNL
jgi:hypothetical protein